MCNCISIISKPESYTHPRGKTITAVEAPTALRWDEQANTLSAVTVSVALLTIEGRKLKEQFTLSHMTDDQLISNFGASDTRAMLSFRERIKAQVTPEEYEQAMTGYKTQIQALLDMVPGSIPLLAATVIVDQLNKDTSLGDIEREMLKAFIVIAAFEMQEF